MIGRLESIVASGLSDKLNLKPGMTCAVVNLPDELDLDLGGDIQPSDDPASADGVISFVVTKADVAEHGPVVFDAAREDRLAWIAYPKGGQLGAEVNRDSFLTDLVDPRVRPVRQISIDDTWSALRFRPS